MSAHLEDYTAALDRASAHARAWLAGVGTRPVPARAGIDDLLASFDHDLPAHGTPADEVIEELATGAEPGLMAIGSGRFHGWVMGGTLPAALAADWLVSTWDQNAGMRESTPGVVALEEVAARWLLDLLGLPAGAGVGFVTGATTANLTGLAAARHAVLTRVGWDEQTAGLTGGPRVHVLVGEERHDTVDLALRYLGLGAPVPVAADEQGRLRVDALADALDAIPAGAPTIVCLQAGNVHSGAFDPFAEAIALAHGRGAWVHVDGAFGLWAAASPSLSALVTGLADADSWATDAHKTLNVPYDCGIAVVADPAALRAAFGMHAAYLLDAGAGPGNPHERVPELSRRARGVPVWAALRSLGRDGVVALVDGLVARAAEIARGVGALDGVHVLHDVRYTQVCFALDDDERTVGATERLAADGRTLLSGSRWHGRAVLRASVSGWSTDADDVATTVQAIRAATAGLT